MRQLSGKALLGSMREKLTAYDYLKQSDEYRMALVTDFLRKNGSASRAELDKILYPGLPEDLSEDQKRYRVGNFLAKMKKLEKIKVDQSDKKRRWILA
jgi:ATP-dependent DNA helicase RecG